MIKKEETVPKSNICTPQIVLDYAEDLRKRYGGLMTITDVGREIGVKDFKSIKKFLIGVPVVDVNGRPKYGVIDFARRIHERRSG